MAGEGQALAHHDRLVTGPGLDDDGVARGGGGHGVPDRQAGRGQRAGAGVAAGRGDVERPRHRGGRDAGHQQGGDEPSRAATSPPARPLAASLASLPTGPPMTMRPGRSTADPRAVSWWDANGTSTPPESCWLERHGLAGCGDHGGSHGCGSPGLWPHRVARQARRHPQPVAAGSRRRQRARRTCV